MAGRMVLMIWKNRFAAAALGLLGGGVSVMSAVVAPSTSAACTCFSLARPEAPLVGRNHDWEVTEGLVLVNKRGVEKTAGIVEPFDRGWTSRFGSVTFTQYGRDLPQGGMNERGLVVATLWLEGAEFPPPDQRMELGPTQWVQYQLDTASSVDEVLESLGQVRISREVPVHYFAADASGAAAAIEFLGGQAVVHRTGRDMPDAVLTNSTYEASLATLKGLGSANNEGAPPRRGSSLDRFTRAARLSRSLAEGSAAGASRRGTVPALPRSELVSGIFAVLDSVSQTHTVWSIVYEPDAGRIHFRSARDRGIKVIDLAALDFDCLSPVLMTDVDLEGEGSLEGRWETYTRQANGALIRKSFRETSFLSDTPGDLLEALTVWPEQSRCAR